MKIKLLIILIFSLATISTSLGQIITTYAGGDSLGLGDGGPATACELKFPYSTAIDLAGNLYIADAGHNLVRRVDVAGTISTVAGTGISGYSGDNGPATLAKLSSPGGVAVDDLGNLYISDCYNHRIRKINSAGVISTVAGIGTVGFNGDNIPATSAELNNPQEIAVDGSGNIYISDALNNRVRLVRASGIITTFAGNGTPGYSGDGGAATDAKISRPYGIAIDKNGDILFTEWGNSIVRKVSTSGVIATVAGTGHFGYSGDSGPATSAALNIPIGIAIDMSDNIYIGDYNNFRVRKISASSGNIFTVVGNGTAGFSGDGGSAIDAQIEGATGLTVDQSGNLFITDRGNFRIRYVKNTVSICDPQYPKQVMIYPNPATSMLNFEFSNAETTTIKLLDITGRIIDERVINNLHQMSFDVSEYTPGLYLYQVITNGETQSGKVLIGK